MYIKTNYKKDIHPEYKERTIDIFPYWEDMINSVEYYNILEEKPSCILPHEYVYRIKKCQYKHKIDYNGYITKDGFICIEEEQVKKLNYSLEEITEILENKEDFVCRDSWLDESQKIFELDREFLLNSYGKYMPKLTFLIPKNYYPVWEEDSYLDVLAKKLNIEWEGTGIDCIFGNFYISKKGTKCFRILPKNKAHHVLIRNKWGGSTRSRRKSSTFTEEDAKGNLYYHLGISHGGNMGRTYAIFYI